MARLPDRHESDGEASKALYRNIRVIGFATYLPLAMFIGPVAGYFVGGWIGAWLGNVFWGRMIGLAFGFAAAVQQVVIALRHILREMK